jgi:hypothetical protein
VRDFSRECVIEVVQFGGPEPLGPSFFSPTPVLTFNLFVGARHAVPVPAFEPQLETTHTILSMGLPLGAKQAAAPKTPTPIPTCTCS